MKDQKFGLELEMTGLTRQKAAEVIAEYFGTQYERSHDSYDSYYVPDNEGRKWRLMSDGSIRCQRKDGNRTIDATRDYSVEFVSPVCEYKDIETIQEIVRKLRENKAIVNNSCGIHCHVSSPNHTPKSIRNFINIIASKNDLLYKSLGIEPERMQYCKALDKRLVDEMNRQKPQTMEQIADIWYAQSYQSRNQHYNDTRYHFLNLHSFFNGNGTCEIRGFNSTLHAGKVKSYIQLSLAMSHQAIIQKRASPTVTASSNEKYTFRTYLLRLGLIGEEFKTARQHLLEKLEGNIAWKNPEDAIRQREARKSQRKASTELAAVTVAEVPAEMEAAEEPEQEESQGMTMY